MGKSKMYVDDLRGRDGGAKSELAHDLAAAREKCIQLLGNGTVADHQYEVFKLVNPQVRLID